MLNLSYEELKEKIKEKATLSDEQVEERVKKKMNDLAGLISKEGAATIIANEVGVQLQTPQGAALTIKKLLPGMRNVEVVGKVTRKFQINHFQSQNRSGKVGSMIIADHTGSVRVALWHDQADNLTALNEGDTIKITSAYVRENNGQCELHANENSKVHINPEGVSVTVAETTPQPARPSAVRKTIKELAAGEENIELLATIVQVFNPTFFSVCPQCGKRAKQEGGAFTCVQHGPVTPDYSYVLNVIVDDGSENIRAVLWKRQAQHLTTKQDNEILEYKDHPERFEAAKTQLLGEIVKLTGRVQRNEMFDRLEFITQLVFLNPDPNTELKRLEENEH